MEAGGERPEESDGADAENPESWYFDLPSGAWERQEAKNRELRQRVLNNLDDAPTKIDPFARKREPEPKRGGLFGMGRKKEAPDAGRETAGGTFRLQRGGTGPGFGDLSGALAHDESAADDWSTEPELPIPLRPRTVNEPVPPALARGYDPEPETDRPVSRWDDAFGAEGDDGGGISAMEAWAKHSTEKPEPRTPFTLRPVQPGPEPEPQGAVEDAPAFDTDEVHAEAATPPMLGFVRRTQEEHAEAEEAPKGERWNELFDNGEDVASGGLSAMAEWARRKEGEPREIPEEFLKPFDWEVEEQGTPEDESPSGAVDAPEWEADAEAVADGDWAAPAALAAESDMPEPWLPVESAEDAATLNEAEPVTAWAADEHTEDASPWAPAPGLPQEPAAWGADDAFAWEEQDAGGTVQPSGAQIDLFDDPLIARALGNEPAAMEPPQEKRRGFGRFFGRRKRAPEPEPVIQDAAPVVVESDWLPVAEEPEFEPPVTDDFRTVAPASAEDDVPEFTPPRPSPVGAVAFEADKAEVPEARAGDIFGFGGGHDARASGWGWERPEPATPVEVQPRDAAAEFEEALAALHKADNAEDWEGTEPDAPAAALAALAEDVAESPEASPAPPPAWQPEAGAAKFEADGPVAALGDPEAEVAAGETSLTPLWSWQPSISDDGTMDAVADEETPEEADVMPLTPSSEASEPTAATDSALTETTEFAWDAEPEDADGGTVDDEPAFAWTDPEPGAETPAALTETPADDDAWNPEPFEPVEVTKETPFASFLDAAASDEPEELAWQPTASSESEAPATAAMAWAPVSAGAGIHEPDGDPAVGWWEPGAEGEAADSPFAAALAMDEGPADSWSDAATDAAEPDDGDAAASPSEATATFEAMPVAVPDVAAAHDDAGDTADDDPWATFMSHRDDNSPAVADSRPADADGDRWAGVLDATDTPAEAFADDGGHDDWLEPEPEPEAATTQATDADDPWAAIAAASGYTSVSPSGSAVYHDSAPESDIVASLDSQMADAEGEDDAWAEFGAARRAPLADNAPTPMYDEGDVVLRAFEQHAAAADPEPDDRWQAPEEKDEPGAFAALLGEDAEELVSEVDPMVETRAFQRLQGWAPQRPARTPVDPANAPWEAHDEEGEAFHDPTAPLPWRGHSDDIAPPPPWATEGEQGDGGAGAAAIPGHSKAKTLVRELIETGLLAVLVFLAVRASFQNFKVDGQSMNPTLADGQFLIVNKLVYSEVNVQKLSNFVPFLDPGNEPQRNVFHGPERGDIVVLVDPHKTDTDLIKRVIGLPGETVEIADGHVYINDHLLKEPYIKTPWHGNASAVTLPSGMYFVMGDNRDNSLDSRSSQVGFIPKDLIIGKAMLSYWPTSKFGLAPNEAGNVSQKDGPPRLTAQRLDGTDP